MANAAKPGKNQTKRKAKRLSPHDVAKSLVQQGEHILYLRQGLYPIIEVHVTLLERSREQLGDLEKTVLELVNAGFRAPDSLATAMGMGTPQLLGFLREIVGKDLLSDKPDGLYLTQLGHMTLEHGAEVVRVQRSLLLCAFTGSLLPRRLYESERVSLDEIPRRVNYSVLLNPEQSVSLSSLKLEHIEDRYAVNVPDKALTVESLDEVRPWFLNLLVALVRGKDQSERAFATDGHAILQISDTQLLRDWLEPLGYSAGKTPGATLVEIEETLLGMGCEAQGDLDGLGNPRIKILRVRPEFEPCKIGDVPAMRFLGSENQAPVPIMRFPPTGRDLLKGRTLSLINQDQTLALPLAQYHEATRLLAGYLQIPFKQRPATFLDYLLQQSSGLAEAMGGLYTLATRFGDGQLRNKVNQKKEQEAE